MSKKINVPSDPDFEYHLWTSEDGKKFMRIKASGRSCEVNTETFRLFSNELMRIKREKNPNIGRKLEEYQPIITVLSLDIFSEGAWIADKKDYTEEVNIKLLQTAFIALLTDKQKKVYWKCIQGDMSTVEFARLHHISDRAVRYTIEAIKKKAENFLF